MAKLLKPREEVKKAIAARIRAGKDLTAKADIAERTAGYGTGSLSLLNGAKRQSPSSIPSMRERTSGGSLAYVTETSEHSSPDIHVSI